MDFTGDAVTNDLEPDKYYQETTATTTNKVKAKSTMFHKTVQAGAHLPLLCLEPVGGEILMSVTPDLWLPSQPQGIIAHWLTPNYTAW